MRRVKKVTELLYSHSHNFKEEDEQADVNQCGTFLYYFCEEVAKEINKIYARKRKVRRKIASFINQKEE